MMHWSTIMLYTGIVLVVLSQVLPLLVSLGIGQLPGDIIWQSKDHQSTFYFPWVSCLVVSIILSLLGQWFSKS